MTQQSYRTDSQSQVPAVAILQANADGTTSGFTATAGLPVTLTSSAGAISSTNPAAGYSVPPPAFTAATGMTPIQTAIAANSLIVKASAGLLFSAYATSTAAGWLMAFNATTAPADGTVTPVHAFPVPANGVGALPPTEFGEFFSAGIVLVFSSTGPFTKTASATAFIHADFK